MSERRYHSFLRTSNVVCLLYLTQSSTECRQREVTSFLRGLDVPKYRHTCTNYTIVSYRYFFISLTFNLLNFVNGIIHLSFLGLSIIIFRDIKMRTWSWSADSIEPSQIARTCRLAWLYIGGKG